METNLQGFDQFRLGLLVRSGGAGGENWTVCRSIFSFYAQKNTQKTIISIAASKKKIILETKSSFYGKKDCIVITNITDQLPVKKKLV